MLDEIGAALGTPVVYLKAAWADPVLYGGRGLRRGCDVDVLVRAPAAAAFACALEERQFRRHESKWYRATTHFGNHAWSYVGPPGFLSVDLHLRLGGLPWFELDAGECIDRAVAYDSVDGAVLSFCPDDQVVFAALHSACHGFGYHQRQLEDVTRLLGTHPVEWAAVHDRARKGGLLLPLFLLLEALRLRGAAVPPAEFPNGRLFARRLDYARRWIATSPDLRRTRPPSRVLDKVRFALLSGRPLALPHHLARYAFLRGLDVVWELASAKS